MTLIDIFIRFVNSVLVFEIMGIPVYAYLITIAIVQFIIFMLDALKDR